MRGGLAQSYCERTDLIMRVKFPSGQQRAFIDRVQLATGLRLPNLAEGVSVCARTLRDWRRERFTISQHAVTQLSKLSEAPVSKDARPIPQYWYIARAARLGGKRRMELHGPLGTPESRRKGGLRSVAKFNQNPERWRQSGFNVRKPITRPKPSELLAEFVGIMLGDGGVRNRWQFTVSFNGREDRAHAKWIYNLIKHLFSITPTYLIRKELGAADLLVTSTAVVELFHQYGIPNGHKLRHGLSIPQWIMENSRYRKACLRGLMDTDGSVYVHRYRVNGAEYRYPKLCFSSASPQLLSDVRGILTTLGYTARISRNGLCVYLEQQRDVDRYFSEIGTHNPRYRQRYELAKRKRGRR